MRRFIVGLLAGIGALTLLSVAAGIYVALTGPFASKPLPDSMVLSLDLRKLPPETASSDLLSGLWRNPRDMTETLRLLWRAADDPRVRGLYVEIGDEDGGLARVQELRQAIARLRAKGKFAIGFAESLRPVATASPTTISPPRSTRSGCSPAATSASPAWRSKPRSSRKV